MDAMANFPGPTLEQGIKQVINSVRETHDNYSGIEDIVTEVCTQDYYEAPPGVDQNGYTGSYGSVMGWYGCSGMGKKYTLIRKVICRLTGLPESPRPSPIKLSSEKSTMEKS